MLILAHISLMIAAVMCIATGVGIAMFGRKKKNWLTWHKRLNITGAIILLTGGGMALTSVFISDGTHLAGLHQRVGATALALCVLTLLLGFYAFRANNKVAVRTVHRWAGRSALLCMVAALILGLRMIGVF